MPLGEMGITNNPPNDIKLDNKTAKTLKDALIKLFSNSLLPLNSIPSTMTASSPFNFNLRGLE